MLSPTRFVASTLVSLATLYQVAVSQVPKRDSGPSPTANVVPIHASLVLELDRAIAVLKRGLKEHWPTRDQYLTAFEKTSGKDPAGRTVTKAKTYVECEIGGRLPTHGVWDEKWDAGNSLNLEVQRTIDEFEARREDQFPGALNSSCAAQVPKRVIVSSGVAAGMLRSKVDPIRPGGAYVTGTVVLLATISPKGRVEALRVISGPAMLQQAALEAVRQWTYRPYTLNNIPIEVETTINVVFSLGH